MNFLRVGLAFLAIWAGLLSQTHETRAGILSSPGKAHLTARQNRKNNNNQNAQQKAQRAAKQRQERAAAAARLQRAQQLALATSNAAGAAHLKLQMAAGKVGTAKESIDTSKEAGASATHELRQLEEEIEDAQAPDSPFVKAEKEADEAAEKFLGLREKIESSPDYKAAKAAALASDNKHERLADIEQKYFTSNPEYIQARSGFDLMGTRLSEIRSHLFAADARWRDAADRAKGARGQESEAKKQLQGSLLKKAEAADSAREAAAAANAAQNLVKLREAQAKAAGANKNGGSKKGYSAGSKKN